MYICTSYILTFIKKNHTRLKKSNTRLKKSNTRLPGGVLGPVQKHIQIFIIQNVLSFKRFCHSLLEGFIIQGFLLREFTT